jgi:hypothetical protein
MALNFPSSPALNQEYTLGNRTWIWNGSGWEQKLASGSGDYTASSTPPTSPTPGDRWFNIDDGVEYTYIQDGTSSQWVEIGSQGIVDTNGAKRLALAFSIIF